MSAKTKRGKTEPHLARRRTGWDIAMGVLLVISAVIVLGHTVPATLMSVLFLGTGITRVIAGVVGDGDRWALTVGRLHVVRRSRTSDR